MIDWGDKGYRIVYGPETGLMDIFHVNYLSRFTEDPENNRNLLKAFTRDPEVQWFFVQASKVVQELGIEYPVACGPIFSHYTHTDETGGGYGLDWHHDWDSMASSSNSCVVWMPLTDVSEDTHGLMIKENGKEELVEMSAGDLLIFSPYLEHKTFVNPAAETFRLALSARFDDLYCQQWAKRKFQCAYSTRVDRDLWKAEAIDGGYANR